MASLGELKLQQKLTEIELQLSKIVSGKSSLVGLKALPGI